MIEEYFHNFFIRNSDYIVDLKDGSLNVVNGTGLNWRIGLIDTGCDTMTGGRILRLKKWICEEAFMVTYGDGVSDIDIHSLVAFHRSHGKLATVTAVRPPARFGGLVLNGDGVCEFSEKPQTGEGWINGGFFVFEPGVFEYLTDGQTILEHEPLERLAEEGQLKAFRHTGFLQPMDTLREKRTSRSAMGQCEGPMENMGMSFWKNRNVFVTGATGLLGSWLMKELLKLRVNVICLIRDWVPGSKLVNSGLMERTNIVRGELEDYTVVLRALNEYEVDTVFHLGAQTIVGTASRSPLSTFEANIRGTWNLMEACRLCSKLVERVVVASSDKAYGAHDQLPYMEDTPLQGRFPYDVSKSCADLISFSYFHTYRTPIAVTRCGNLFGGWGSQFQSVDSWYDPLYTAR